MKGFWLLVHLIGMTAWLGGGLANMLGGITAKSFAPAERLAAYRLMGAVHRSLVGPGAVLVLISGIMLTVSYMKIGITPGWLNLMMGTGMLGGLITIALQVPTAARLARLELDPRGELPESFAGLRKRLAFSGMSAGILILIALLAGTILR
jgi:hypothetical protein